MPRMSLRIRLGPLVYFQVEGESCQEITRALEGFDELNRRVDAMCSDLAERVYPEGVDTSRPGKGQESEA
jgi:hypothetical protein